jgi:peptide-methionine (S)-S-oxide reductase
MTTELAVLAGGCFWGMQELIRKMPGVVSTRVGYTGGDVPNATYRNHGSHAEAIEILFDPAQTSYRRLLEFYFQIHDPTTVDRQGNDRGASYRSAIYFTSDDQEAIARDTIADVEASGLWPGKGWKAVRVTAGAGVLEEKEDPVAAAQLVEGQRSGCHPLAVDPADVAQRRSRLAGDPYLHRAISSRLTPSDGSKAQAAVSARRGSTQPGRTKWQV